MVSYFFQYNYNKNYYYYPRVMRSYPARRNQVAKRIRVRAVPGLTVVSDGRDDSTK